MTSRLGRSVSLMGPFVAYLGFAFIHSRWLAPTPFALLSDPRLWGVLLLSAVVAGLTFALGLPEMPTSRSSVAVRSVAASVIALGLVSMVQLVLGRALLPRSVMLGGTAVAVVWQLIAWNLAGDRASKLSRRVLFVGSPSAEAELAEGLATSAESPAVIVDSLDPWAAVGSGVEVPLVDLAESCQADIVVLDAVAQAEPSVVSQAATVHAGGTRVRTLAMFSSEFLGKVPLAEVERVSLLFDVGELHDRVYPRMKRLVDLTFALCCLPALAVLAGMVAVANPLGNRGPLLFRQTRVGKGGREFEIIKFRTMTPGGSSEWTASEDPRITPLGGFLRRSHLDELPQLWNMVRGDLSLVGPRPEQPHYVTELTHKLPFYPVRHITRPGLTGWAQVKMGYQSDLAGAVEKLQYDLHYLREQNLRLDLIIVGRTARSVIGQGGR